MSIRDCEFFRCFIDIYKDLPEIWQIKSANYKNRDKKKEAWEMLLQKYKEHDSHATIDVVKRKIMSMRASYRRELAKIKKSERSGAGTDSIYVPTLWYFNELEFLRDQETQIEGTSTIDVSDEENENDVPTTQAKKRKSHSQQDTFLQRAVEHLDQAKKRREKDEADVFSEGWAIVYRKLNSEQQIYAKQAIDEILLQGQLNKLNLDFIQNVRNQHLERQQIHPLSHYSHPYERSRTSHYVQPYQSQSSSRNSCSTPSELSVPSPSSVQPSYVNVCLPTSGEQIVVSQECSQRFQELLDDAQYQ